MGELAQGTATLGGSSGQEQQEWGGMKAGTNGHSDMTCAQISWSLEPKKHMVKFMLDDHI